MSHNRSSGALHGSPRMRPSTWFVWHAHRIVRGGRVVDLACGEGRHSIAATGLGCQVVGIDRHPVPQAWRDASPPQRVIGTMAGAGSRGLMAPLFDAVLVFRSSLTGPTCCEFSSWSRPAACSSWKHFSRRSVRRAGARPRARIRCARVSLPAWLPHLRSCMGAKPGNR